MSVMAEQTPLSCVAACVQSMDCDAISVSSFPYGMPGSCTFFSRSVSAAEMDGPFDYPYSDNAGTEYTAVLNRR